MLRCEIQYRLIHDMVRFGGQGLAWAGSAWLLGAWDLGLSVGFLRDEVHLGTHEAPVCCSARALKYIHEVLDLISASNYLVRVNAGEAR